jgi:hypothetical protein
MRSLKKKGHRVRKHHGKEFAHKPSRRNLLNEQSENAAPEATLDYHCSKHPDTALWNVMAGGAGFCKRCGCYVQAAGVEMPQLDPEFAARREAALIEAKRVKRNTAAKVRRVGKAAQATNDLTEASVTR